MTAGNRAQRRRTAAHQEAAAWKGRHDALLTILNAVLLAYGDSSDERRLSIANEVYYGQPRRNVAVLPLGRRIVVYLEPAPAQEDTND